MQSVIHRIKKFFSSGTPSSSIKHKDRQQTSARYGGMGEREMRVSQIPNVAFLIVLRSLPDLV